MDILKYGDYEGTAELDMARQVCRGKILFINDLVTYEAASPADLQREFEAAVDDYIETCAVLGRKPQKPVKGLFQVRVPPSMHKAGVLRAMADNVRLNEVVVRALDAYLNAGTAVNHNVQVTVKVPAESLKTLMSSTSGPEQWSIALAQPQGTPPYACH